MTPLSPALASDVPGKPTPCFAAHRLGRDRPRAAGWATPLPGTAVAMAGAPRAEVPAVRVHPGIGEAARQLTAHTRPRAVRFRSEPSGIDTGRILTREPT